MPRLPTRAISSPARGVALLAVPLLLLGGCVLPGPYGETLKATATEDTTTAHPGMMVPSATDAGTDTDTDPGSSDTDGTGTGSTSETTEGTSSGPSSTGGPTTNTSNTSNTSNTNTDSDSDSDTGETGGFGDSPLAEPITTEVFTFLGMDVADIDGDGDGDLVLEGSGFPPRVTVYPSLGDGGFGAGETTEVPTFEGFVVADVTGDGRADLVTSGSGFPPRLQVHAADGGLGFDAPTITEVWSHSPAFAAPFDLDGDGRADPVLDNDGGFPPRLLVYGGEGDGGVAQLSQTDVWNFVALAAAGDCDGDGLGDVVTGADGFPPRLYVWPGDGEGGLGGQDDVVETDVFTFSLLDVGDLDGDGVCDAVTNVPNNAWRLSLYRGVGDGGFAVPANHDGYNFEDLEVADVDGDGRADVITKPTGQPPRVDVYLSQ